MLILSTMFINTSHNPHLKLNFAGLRMLLDFLTPCIIIHIGHNLILTFLVIFFSQTFKLIIFLTITIGLAGLNYLLQKVPKINKENLFTYQSNVKFHVKAQIINTSKAIKKTMKTPKIINSHLKVKYRIDYYLIIEQQ